MYASDRKLIEIFLNSEKYVAARLQDMYFDASLPEIFHNHLGQFLWTLVLEYVGNNIALWEAVLAYPEFESEDDPKVACFSTNYCTARSSSRCECFTHLYLVHIDRGSIHGYGHEALIMLTAEQDVYREDKRHLFPGICAARNLILENAEKRKKLENT
jgi:hypothetical protein